MYVHAHMSRHMGAKTTTVRLPEALLERAKKAALREGTTVTALIAEGLAARIAHKPKAQAEKRKIELPVSKAKGGLLPGYDWATLSYQLQEEDDLDMLARTSGRR